MTLAGPGAQDWCARKLREGVKVRGRALCPAGGWLFDIRRKTECL